MASKFEIFFALFLLLHVGFSALLLNTMAGSGSSASNGDGGSLTSAGIYGPRGLALDKTRNLLYIAEFYGHKVRVINLATNSISTVVGTGTAGSTGNGGAATSATLNYPLSVAIDEQSNLLYVSDQSNLVRLVNLNTGVINAFAGGGASTSEGVAATSYDLNFPLHVSVDAVRNKVYVSQQSNHKVKVIDRGTGIIDTLIGSGNTPFNGDGISATTAACANPAATMINKNQPNLVYVACMGYTRVRVVNVTSGIASTFMGTGSGSPGNGGDGGSAATANVDQVNGMSMEYTSNTMYLAQYANHIIRSVNMGTNIASTVAGTLGTRSFSGDGGNPTSGTFNYPVNVEAVNPYAIVISDMDNNRIRILKDTCPGGTSGIACSVYSCFGISSSSGSVCSGHGSCAASDSCSCNGGYTGANCDAPTMCGGILSTSGSVCSGHGTCVANNTCNCVSNLYGGPICEPFTCNGLAPSLPYVCSGRGACLAMDSCDCAVGYTGSSCQYPVCNGLSSADPNVCNGTGICRAPSFHNMYHSPVGYASPYNVKTGPRIILGTRNWDISVLLKKTSASSGVIWAYDRSGDGSVQFRFTSENDNSLHFASTNVGATEGHSCSTPASTTSIDTWYSVLVSRRGSLMTITVNGTQLASCNGGPVYSMAEIVANRPYFMVGARYSPGGGTSEELAFPGLISNARIVADTYNVAPYCACAPNVSGQCDPACSGTCISF